MRHQEKNKDEVRILGIDPGSVICGYGVIERVSVESVSQQSAVNSCKIGADDCTYLASGRIALSSKDPLHVRLKELYETLLDIIREYRPHEAVVERVFFAKGARAALSLGQARGIALLAAASEGLSVHEYSALEVKKAIVGYGRAEKRQVQEMVRAILKLKISLSPDGADALALCLCHMNTLKFKEAIDR